MSSKVNEALYDLITSMSKSEKRYFKLMSSRHTIGEENNYVRIFDHLDKQASYDEGLLFEKFKGEAFLNRFSITKKRLYDHVLSALDSFHSSNSIEAQIHKMLHSADILFERSLYDQSRRILRSAEKLALKYEKSVLMIEISNKQKRILETGGYVNISDADLVEMSDNLDVFINRIKEYNKIWSVKSQLFAQLAKKGVARSEEESKNYTELCSPLLNDYDPENITTEGKYLYSHALSAYYYSIADLEKSLGYLKLNLELFNETPKELEIEPIKQISVLTNAIYISDKIGEYRIAIVYLNQLKSLANGIESNEDLEIKLFSSISSIELSMNLRKGAFKDASKIAIDIEQKLLGFGDKITSTRRAFLEFKIAVAYIGVGEFNIALKWVNKILNDSELDKTEDIIGFTQLLDLLVHIELNHDKLLPYSLKSTQRFFKTRNRMYSFEKVFLQFIGRLVKCKDHFEM
ncbi:MAG: hypothetical protein HRT57_15695 [Crocinitomicaceae bacterium]|nr:hypothetical protein [Crocinitomicaceae bacterium]